ncbi:MAG: 50S ribosomal protein L11 methyltransferase [Burkholderiales bacterium]|nr:50S ribosomal protein L11 methyltransferase [Burkholderiales bacterium]
MPWLTVSLETDAGRSEELADALLEAGAMAVDVSDAAAGTLEEKPVFGEPGAPIERPWERAFVRALFPAETDLHAAMARILSAADLPLDAPYRIEPVDDQDWVRLTQSQFSPQRVTDRLWIVPSWHAAPDPDAINIVLDPGLAFGTGTHPTTRLCLRWLAAHLHGGESVIDFGCGSGILAITALKLGAAVAHGVDVDEQALLAARYNAERNGVTVEFHGAAEKLQRAAQVVVANILSNPLRVLAPLLARLTEPRGRVVLAGILDAQAGEVRDAYVQWFEMDTTEYEDGWVLLSGIRR